MRYVRVRMNANALADPYEMRCLRLSMNASALAARPIERFQSAPENVKLIAQGMRSPFRSSFKGMRSSFQCIPMSELPGHVKLLS